MGRERAKEANKTGAPNGGKQKDETTTNNGTGKSHCCDGSSRSLSLIVEKTGVLLEMKEGVEEERGGFQLHQLHSWPPASRKRGSRRMRVRCYKALPHKHPSIFKRWDQGYAGFFLIFIIQYLYLKVCGDRKSVV